MFPRSLTEDPQHQTNSVRAERDVKWSSLMTADYTWRIVSAGKTRDACFALRAAEYSRYYRNIPKEQFSDEYDDATTANGVPVSQLIVVESEGEVVGTCRLVLTRHPAHPHLRSEISDLTDLPCNGTSLQCGGELDASVVAELGKFAVSTSVDIRRVKWMLLTATGIIAGKLGIQQVLALMPPLVERAARHAGVAFRQVETVRLRRDTPFAKKYLLQYHDYFLPTLRKMGRTVNLEQLETSDLKSLDLLLADVPDGPKLWSITPAELASARYPGKE